MQKQEVWAREHRLSPAVVITVAASPIDAHWIVTADGWELPRSVQAIYATKEEAQRAADDALQAHQPHDCGQRGCGDWVLATVRVYAWNVKPPSAG